jgi:hyperpolarization activated cyclic nucleotide-gated potassium channel 2
MITSKRAMALNYLKFWFWLDFIASFPYELVLTELLGDMSDEEGEGDGSSSVYKSPQLLKLIRLFRFAKLIKLIRLCKMKKILLKLEDILDNS